MHPPKSAAIVISAIAALTLVGCSSDSATPAETVTVTATPTEAMSPSEAISPTEAMTESPTNQATGTELTATEAIDAAVQLVPGDAIEGGRTGEAGRPVWYVTVRENKNTATEVYVDRVTGDLVQKKPENVPVVAQGKLPSLTAEQGIQKALEVSPGGSVVEFELESFRGTPAWYVFSRGGSNGQREVYVNANSGAVLKQGRG